MMFVKLPATHKYTTLICLSHKCECDAWFSGSWETKQGINDDRLFALSPGTWSGVFFYINLN